MSDMVKYRAGIGSFLKLTALYFTVSEIVHRQCSSRHELGTKYGFYKKGLKTFKLNFYLLPISRIVNRGRFKKKFYKNWLGHRAKVSVTFPCGTYCVYLSNMIHFNWFFFKLYGVVWRF